MKHRNRASTNDHVVPVPDLPRLSPLPLEVLDSGEECGGGIGKSVSCSSDASFVVCNEAF
jgi:hypothetical protein